MKSADLFSGSEQQSDLKLSSGRLNLSLRQSYLGAWFETLGTVSISVCEAVG